MLSIFIDFLSEKYRENTTVLHCLAVDFFSLTRKIADFFVGKNIVKILTIDSAFVTVILGIFMAGWIIKNSFSAWEEHPVVTSVMQKSIEEINFPAITICPLDDTRFGYLEEHLNSEENSEISIENLVTDLARVLYARHPTGI